MVGAVSHEQGDSLQFFFILYNKCFEATAVGIQLEFESLLSNEGLISPPDILKFPKI